MAGRPWLGRGVRLLLPVVVVAAIFFGVLPQVADYAEVWRTIAAMTWLETTAIAVLAVWNLVSYLLPQLAALPGLGFGQAVVESHASTAVGNTVPAGAAVGPAVTFQLYGSWGFSRADTTRSLVVQGVWNNLVKLGMPIVALALLTVGGHSNPGLATAALVGVGVLAAAVVLLALVLWRDDLARRVGDGLGAARAAVGRALRRPVAPAWGEAAVRFRGQTAGLLRHRWAWLTVATLVSHLSLYLLLLVTLRNVGVSDAEVSWTEVLGAFSFVRLLSALPITPGGLGVVELGLTAALVGAGGNRGEVVAAVLLFRALTWLLPIPIGAATYLGWRASRAGRGYRAREVAGGGAVAPGRPAARARPGDRQ
jgi:putative heme transporter